MPRRRLAFALALTLSPGCQSKSGTDAAGEGPGAPSPEVETKATPGSEPEPDPEPDPEPEPEPVVMRDAPITPDGCVRLGGEWRCAAPTPTPPSPDVVDVRVSEKLRCELFASGLLRCNDAKPKAPFELEGVELVDVHEHELAISRKTSPRQVLSPFDSDRANLLRIDDRDDIVEIGTGWRQCVRTSADKLLCGSVEFDDVQAFDVGVNHACRVSQGQLTCWSDYGGVLDADGATTRSFPMLPPVASVSIVPRYQCVLTQAGKVWCWGDNRRGELGQDLDLRYSSEPLEIPGLANVVSMRNFPRHSCALLDNGDLRCWGEVPEALADKTKIPEPEYDGCVSSVEGWATRLRAATASPTVVRELLLEAGLLSDRRYLAGSRAPRAELELEVRVSPAELDGHAPAETFVEVHLRVSGQPRRVLAAVYVENEAGRSCAVGASQLSAGLEPAADVPLPGEPEFVGPASYELVELLAAGRPAIGRRLGVGSESSDPSASSYVLSYFTLDNGELRELFGPFVLYESMTSSYIDDPTRSGSIELSAEFPRTITTHTTTDCAPLRDACQRNPEACQELDTTCEDGTVTEIWEAVDGRYRRRK